MTLRMITPATAAASPHLAAALGEAVEIILDASFPDPDERDAAIAFIGRARRLITQTAALDNALVHGGGEDA